MILEALLQEIILVVSFCGDERNHYRLSVPSLLILLSFTLIVKQLTQTNYANFQKKIYITCKLPTLKQNDLMHVEFEQNLIE